MIRHLRISFVLFGGVFFVCLFGWLFLFCLGFVVVVVWLVGWFGLFLWKVFVCFLGMTE